MANEYRTAVLADSPVGYWRLGESSGLPQDSAGTTNANATTGSPTYGVTGALANDTNTAITLNGSSYFHFPGAVALNVGDVFSVELWFKRSATQGTPQALATKGSGGWMVSFQADDKLYLTHQDIAHLATSAAITDTNWHHAVVTKNGATRKVYIDGVDVTISIGNSTVADTPDEMFIGARSGGTTIPFPGSIDEVALYPTALSAARVLAHYVAASTIVGTGVGTGAAATASGTGTMVETAAPSHGHGAPLGAARVIGPAGDRSVKPRLRSAKGSGGGMQPAASAYGSGIVNDDELVLTILEAA